MNDFVRAKITIELEDGTKVENEGIARVIKRDPFDRMRLRCYHSEDYWCAEHYSIPETWIDFEGSIFPGGMKFTVRER